MSGVFAKKFGRKKSGVEPRSSSMYSSSSGVVFFQVKYV